MTGKQGPNDAHDWAYAAGELRAKGIRNPEMQARRLIAEKRRVHLPHLRTFAPGDKVPYDVTEATDLDGDRWVRLGPAVNERDMWRMPGLDPDEHESSCGGCQLTPHLLESWGPLTEVKR